MLKGSDSTCHKCYASARILSRLVFSYFKPSNNLGNNVWLIRFAFPFINFLAGIFRLLFLVPLCYSPFGRSYRKTTIVDPLSVVYSGVGKKRIASPTYCRPIDPGKYVKEKWAGASLWESWSTDRLRHGFAGVHHVTSWPRRHELELRSGGQTHDLQISFYKYFYRMFCELMIYSVVVEYV